MTHELFYITDLEIQDGHLQIIRPLSPATVVVYSKYEFHISVTYFDQSDLET